MKTTFKAVEGSRINDLDANIIGKRIKELKPNGHITAQELLEDAKNENSPIHNYFEWNNTKAANEYRLEQARGFIRSIKICIVSNGESWETKAFHHIKVSTADAAYVDCRVVATNADYYSQILKLAISEIKKWKEKYSNYQELKKIFNAIECYVNE